MGQLLDIPAILLTLAVVFGLINHWFVRCRAPLAWC